MSFSVLFGNSNARGTSKNLVELKAGKMTMKGKMVYPDNRKGQLYVYQSDDSLMHFCWKDRTTGVVEDDLIIFPDDCEFKHVSQCKTGRVYLLKFKSSSRKFFFWLQDLKTDKDEEHCRKINEVLNNPPTSGSQRSSGTNSEGDLQNLLKNMSQQQLMQLFGVGQIGQIEFGNLLGTMNRPFGGNRSSSTTSSLTPITTTTTRPPASVTPSPATVPPETPKPAGNNKSSSQQQQPQQQPQQQQQQPARATEPSAPAASTNNSNRIRLVELQSFFSGIPTPPGTEGAAQKGLVGELSAAIPAAISVNESLEGAMSAHLPAGDSLSTTLSSPQFSQALQMFWSALQSGQAAPIMRQFGLDTEAVNAAVSGNIERFVSALEKEATRKPRRGETPAGATKETTDDGSTAVTESEEGKSTEQSKSQQQAKSEGEDDKKKREDEDDKKNQEDDDDEGMALD